MEITVLKSRPVLRESSYNGRWGRIGSWLHGKLSKSLFDDKLEICSINVSGLVEAILKQREVCEMIWNREVEMIVVGPDAWYELHDLRHPITMWPEIQLANESTFRTFRGIPIRFVPYIEGVLCIPKV